MTVGLSKGATWNPSFRWGNSSVITNKKLEDMSDAEYQDYINRTKIQRDRESELIGVTQNRGPAKGQSVNPGEQDRLSAATGGASNLGAYNFQTGTFGDLTKQAKELAEFNLGLNQRQGEFDFDKRNKEFDANTGRQMRVNEQQNKWQSDLNRETQEAQTKRLGLQIEGQDRQQRTGIDQENFATDRAVRLASRRLGG
jgi:hypothetical protein